MLAGRNVVLCAPTASGKTEAVIAPLIERHASHRESLTSPIILYLSPTKALVNDLWGRLTTPLELLGISLGVKTRDVNTLRRDHIPAVLISTPESCDSLLATQAKLLANLRAIVIDELHLFDGTARGDQLRIVLNRIRRIRSYAVEHSDAVDDDLQYVALSASLPQPELAAMRYFPDPVVISTGGARAINAELVALAPENSRDLLLYFETFRERGWRKALVFCNSRMEVEAYAATVRANSPFGDAVFVHYSNLEPKRRREIEGQFSSAEAAICFASSTLELGIDIGNIDIVLLIGAPGSLGSFLQRIGRGSRRQKVIQVACFYRTPLELRIFEVLCSDLNTVQDEIIGAAFRPSVAIQQIFSLLKQNPSGSVRLAELETLFTNILGERELRAIIGQLEQLQYLKPGRSGEWRAGERLNQLADKQANPYNLLSLHSNIKSNERTIAIRDRYTHRTVAHVEPQMIEGSLLTLEGRTVNIEWYDGEAIWVSAVPEQADADKLRYRSTRQVMSYSLAQKLATSFNLKMAETLVVSCDAGWLWFHWLGDLYGTALYDLVRDNSHARSTSQLGLCMLFSDNPSHLTLGWSLHDIERYLTDNYRRLGGLMDLGAYYHLLPTALKRQSVIDQFNVERFQSTIDRMTIMEYRKDVENTAELAQFTEFALQFVES